MSALVQNRKPRADSTDVSVITLGWVGWALSRLTRSGHGVAEGKDEFHPCSLSLASVWYLPLHTSWTRVEQIDEIWSSRCRWYRWISSFLVRTCIVNQEQIPRLRLFLGVLQTRSSSRRRRGEARRGESESERAGWWWGRHWEGP